MWELDCEEGWVPKNWRFWTVVLENTLEGPLDFKEIQPVHSKGDQSWVFFGRNYAKAETPVLWAPHVKSWLTGKDSDAGRDWGQEEKGTTEDEMAGWHHGLDGCEFEWTLGVDDGQGGLACCHSWGLKESDMTEQLNWTELNWTELPVSDKNKTKLPKNKILDQMAIQKYSIKNFKEGLMLIFLQLLQKCEEEGTLSNSFYNVSLMLKPKILQKRN